MTLQFYFDNNFDHDTKQYISNSLYKFKNCANISISDIKRSLTNIDQNLLEIKLIRNAKTVNIDDDFIVNSTDLIFFKLNQKFIPINMKSGIDSNHINFTSTNLTILNDVKTYIKNIALNIEFYEADIANKMYDDLCDIIEKLEETSNISNQNEINIYVNSRTNLWQLIRNNTVRQPNSERKPSPYINFCSQNRPLIKSQNPDITFGELGQKLGELWNELTEEQKNNYII